MSFYKSHHSMQRDKETGLLPEERRQAVLVVEGWMQGKPHLPFALRDALKKLIPELRD